MLGPRRGRGVINPNQLVDDVDAVAAAIEKKGVAPDLAYAAQAAALRRRSLVSALDDLRAEMNRRSKEMSRLVAAKDAGVDALRRELGSLKARISETEAEHRDAEAVLREAMYQLPNLPSPDAPVGKGEADNVVLRYEGPPVDQYAGREYRTHWDVATDLGIFDAQRAAKLSGSGFALLYGDGARLLRGLVNFALDLNRDTYTEVLVPHLVRSEVMTGTGHLPKFADDAYHTTTDDLWLIPTGEVPLTGLHQGEILDDLPKRYMTHTACFRREAGSAGKDTRGFQRVHEFHKVELVRICTPDTVQDEFDALLADAERALRVLELPYRVVDLCTGDLTFASARIFDLEVYAPGVDRWLEVSSIGNFTDFQARRGGIRHRTAAGQTEFVYTLNGSALATPRMWAAIIEHGQRPDGSVELPDALAPFVGTKVLRPRT
jgi:seryl-tRNA synthetase